VCGVFGVDRDDMFVDVILMHLVEMAVVKIVHMAVMANRRVPTVRAMLMGVVGMVLFGTIGHDFPSFIYNPTGTIGPTNASTSPAGMRIPFWACG
jgi:hypothetical protein